MSGPTGDRLIRVDMTNLTATAETSSQALGSSTEQMCLALCGRRISERELLVWALAGGSVAATCSISTPPAAEPIKVTQRFTRSIRKMAPTAPSNAAA